MVSERSHACACCPSMKRDALETVCRIGCVFGTDKTRIWPNSAGPWCAFGPSSTVGRWSSAPLFGPRVQSKRLQRWYRFRNEPSPATLLQRAMAAPILIDANTWAAHWRMVESELDYTCPPSISRSGCTIWAQRPRGSCWMRRRPPLATTSSMVRWLSGPQTARLSRPTEANA
jgi:hypothetical protein